MADKKLWEEQCKSFKKNIKNKIWEICLWTTSSNEGNMKMLIEMFLFFLIYSEATSVVLVLVG